MNESNREKAELLGKGLFSWEERVAAIEAALEEAAVIRPKMFPIQTDRNNDPHPRQIPWGVAEEAYTVYAKQYGKDQSLETLAERGGFGSGEMDLFLPGWRERCDAVAEAHAAGLAEGEAKHDGEGKTIKRLIATKEEQAAEIELLRNDLHDHRERIKDQDSEIARLKEFAAQERQVADAQIERAEAAEAKVATLTHIKDCATERSAEYAAKVAELETLLAPDLSKIIASTSAQARREGVRDYLISAEYFTEVSKLVGDAQREGIEAAAKAIQAAIPGPLATVAASAHAGGMRDAVMIALALLAPKKKDE